MKLYRSHRLQVIICALSFCVAAAWTDPVSADVKTAHGASCVPDDSALNQGGSWQPTFNGLTVQPGSNGAGVLCSITRDDSLQPLDEVRVGVDPSSASVACYVYSVAQNGSAYDLTGSQVSSGSSPQVLTFSGVTMTNLDEYDNGTYHVACTSSSWFTLSSIWWDET